MMGSSNHIPLKNCIAQFSCSKPAGFLLLKFFWINERLVDWFYHQFAAVHAFGCNDVINVWLYLLSTCAHTAFSQACSVSFILRRWTVAWLRGLCCRCQFFLQVFQTSLFESCQVRSDFLGYQKETTSEYKWPLFTQKLEFGQWKIVQNDPLPVTDSHSGTCVRTETSRRACWAVGSHKQHIFPENPQCHICSSFPGCLLGYALRSLWPLPFPASARRCADCTPQESYRSPPEKKKTV